AFTSYTTSHALSLNIRPLSHSSVKENKIKSLISQKTYPKNGLMLTAVWDGLDPDPRVI
ncbi:hypothetical protein KUCAC02_013523, partial [Chaenocephalus aceratus]